MFYWRKNFLFLKKLIIKSKTKFLETLIIKMIDFFKKILLKR